MAKVRVIIDIDEPGIPESTILSALKRMQQGQYMMGQQPVLESAAATMQAKIVGRASKGSTSDGYGGRITFYELEDL